MIAWIVIAALLAIVVGVLLSVTTVRVDGSKIGDARPLVFRLTIVWPSGPVTYVWPRQGRD